MKPFALLVILLKLLLLPATQVFASTDPIDLNKPLNGVYAEWQRLIRQNQHLSELQKVEVVNQFFNQRIEYVTDDSLYSQKDYWATPYETLSRQAGDCEDFAIAKYFTLKALNVSPHRLHITYMKQKDGQQPHMVLAYLTDDLNNPLILDNRVTDIKPQSSFRNYQPVYSFNESSLWLNSRNYKSSPDKKAEELDTTKTGNSAVPQQQWIKVSSSDRLNRWRLFRERLAPSLKAPAAQ